MRRNGLRTRDVIVGGIVPLIVVGLAQIAAAQDLHPQDELRIRPDGVPVIEVHVVPVDLPTSARAIIEAIRGATLLSRIGVEEGPEEQIFGRIDDVAVDEDERIYVVDRTSSTVRVFRPDGDFLAEVGRAGEGPGEFNRPRGLFWDSSRRRLVVADMSRSLQEFQWSADTDSARLEFVDRVPIEMSPEDLCQISASQYVAQAIRFATREAAMAPGRFPAHALHFVGQDGAETSSFGAMYAAEQAGVNLQMTFGQVNCSPGASAISYTPEAGLGETHLFTAAGRLRAVVRYVDVMPIEVRQMDASRTRTSVPAAGYHALQSSTFIGESWLLVKFVLKIRGEFGLEPHGALTYLVDVAAPGAYHVEGGLPAVVARRGSLIVTIQREPFPQLQVWRVSR